MAASSAEVYENAEGEELTEPLLYSLHDLQGMQVTLYDLKISPPCAKLRMLLAYYRVPFEAVPGKRPTGKYTKVPALDIGDRQLNDSFIIVKNLAPVLQGHPMTDEEIEIEKNTTYGLMVALEKDVAGSSSELRRCACLVGGFSGFLLWTCSCYISLVGPKRIGTRVAQFLGTPLGEISYYGTMLRDQLGEKDFFGGKEPKVLDVSVFGMLVPFDSAGCSCLDTLLGPSNDVLNKWYFRMKVRTSDIKI